MTAMSSETLTLDTSTLFLNSYNSLSLQSPQPSPPFSFTLLSNHSPLPPIPSDFPQSKLIPKTRFVVDGFRYAGDYSASYFLSHFHSDHYTGLTPNWSRGIVFCSETTARLLVEVLKVSSLFVVPLSLSKPVSIDGCEVSLIDANHCPGAVQFLFKIPGVDGNCERYVHTGDFRYCSSMKLEPIMCKFLGADGIFLDTTYCNPKFVFPSQEESIDYIVSVIQRVGVENEGTLKSVLFLVATYVIGKERILLEISRRCNRNIHVDGRKMAILRVLGFGKDGVFTEEESESDVHVVGWNVLGETWPYFRPNFVKMKEIMNERGYSKVVGFVPTGWTYEVKRNKFAVRTKDSFEIHLVPYSEHSNYDELREYVKFLRPKHVIPTVGVDVEKIDSKHANAMRKHFAGLVDEMAIKQDFLMGFHRGSWETLENVEKDSDTVPNEAVDHEKEVISPELKTINNIELGNNSSCPQKDPVSKDLVVSNDNETEEIMQELCDCLPTWVTRNQMLELLSNSGRNVVEAVSNFYERETEFHEQVVGCTCQTSSPNASASLPKPFSGESPPRKVNVLLSQSYSPNTRHLVKRSMSPSKKRRNIDNKLNKKARINSSLESSGPKQYPITRFFSKLTPNISQGGGVETVFEQCLNDESLLASDSNSIKSYKEEVDQFIQIINGSESLRSYAATILEETKGDINMALDIYYNNPQGNLSVNKERLVESSKSDQAQCSTWDCSFREENKGPDELRNMADLAVPGLATEAVAANLVSLAPEKYSPIEHACWRDGQPAPYIHLARTFDLVEDEKGKIKATSMLCNMLRSLLALSPEDVLPAVYLCTNKIAPDHENMELNIGGSIVVAALEEACGTNRSKIKDLYNSLGDLGDVAQLCRQTQSLLAPPSPLSIRGVFSVLRKIRELNFGPGEIGKH
uniref:DNA ligase 6 n=1 Tax=Davidia involucrata TaxID=16924 RepID=A0A5B7BRY2_DAVIN